MLAERRFPHGGARGHDDEVALLQAARLLVEVDEAGGQPGDQLLALGELVDGAEALLDDLPDADEALPDAVLGDVEDRLLRAVEDESGLVLRLVGVLGDAVAGVDQVPEDGLLLDDPAPLLDVRDARHPVDERGQVGGAPHRLQRLHAHELVLQGDEINGLAALGQGGHGVEHAPVRLAIEVVAGEDLGRGVEGLVVDEDGAEDGPLRLRVVGQRAVFFEDDVSGHGSSGRRSGILLWGRPSRR